MEAQRSRNRRALRVLLTLLLGLGFVREASAALSLTYSLPTAINTYTALNAPAVVTGGTPPYTFSISLGALPSGLSLDPATGSITGTATTWPGGTFVVHVIDANSQVATYPGFLIIAAPIASQFNAFPDGSSYFNPANGEGAQSLIVLNQGGSPPLELILYYSPFLTANGFTNAVGYNWATNFDARLSISPSQILARMPDGRSLLFSVNGSSFVLTSQAEYGTQLVTQSGGYGLYDPHTDSTYSFSSSGILTGEIDNRGNQLTVTPGTSGPAQVTGSAGSFNFTYGSAGLTSVTDSAGDQVLFTHTLNRLATITLPDGSLLKFTYTPNGAMNGWTDQNNDTFSITVDALSRVTKLTDPLSDSTSIVYNGAATVVTDANGNSTTFVSQNSEAVVSITDPAGDPSTGIALSGNFQPTSVTDPAGNQFQFAYHPQTGYPQTITDALGNPINFTYTPRPQGAVNAFDLTKVTFPDNTFLGITRDSSGNPLTVTDQAGSNWINTFTSQGFLSTQTNPASGVTRHSYDARGNELTLTDAAGNATTYSWDASNRPLQISYADGKSVSLAWDRMNRPLTITNENNAATKFIYDSAGNLTSVTDPLGDVVKTFYDGNSRVASRIDPLGNTTTFQYDPGWNLTGIILPDSETFKTTYDELGRVRRGTDASGVSESFGYDAASNLTSITDGLNNITKFTFDANGSVTGITSPLGGSTSFILNPMRKVSSCTDPTGRGMSFSYTTLGSFSNITVGATSGQLRTAKLSGAAGGTGISASFAYDSLGLLSSRTDPNGNTWTVKNDTSGRLASITDPLNRTTSYTYDQRNRVSGSTNPLGSVEISHDGAGNETQRKYSDGTTFNFSYDADNRLMSGTGVSLGYDAAGNLISSNGLTMTRNPVGKIATVTYATGKTVTYTYDSGGRLKQITDWAGGSVSFAYDGAGRLITVSRSNAVTTKYAYDNDSRVASITESSGSQVLAGITYQRDAAGKVISETRNEPQVFTPANGVAGFTYDAAEQPSGAGYASDGVGRVTQTPFGTLTWNLASNVTAYNVAGRSGQFGYDALGMRTSAATGSGPVEKYVINYGLALPSIATVQSGGTDQRYYIYSPDGALLYAIDAAGNARHYYHFDALGTTTFLSSDQGQVTDSYAMGAYGEDILTTGNTVNPFTWLGEWGVMQEGNTGLYYMRARYYDSTSARFLSPDPLEHFSPLDIDPYGYASADPESNRDATGMGEREDDEQYGLCLGRNLGSAVGPELLLRGYYLGFGTNWGQPRVRQASGTSLEEISWIYKASVFAGNLVNYVFFGTAWDLGRTGLGFVTAGLVPAIIQAAIGVKQDINNGLGWYLTFTDAAATVFSLVATYSIPWGGPLDFVTAGTISGGVHNLLFIPYASVKVALFRTTSQDQTAIQKVLTRAPVINAVWGLGEKLANTSAGSYVTDKLATVLGWLPQLTK